MFDAKQFREKIIRHVLHGIGMWDENAEELMMGTVAAESLGGTYLTQVIGPALGVFQMEPKTHDDIWQKWLPNHPAITANLMSTCMISMKPAASMMVSNLFYATAMARILYFRNCAHKVPAGLEKQAEYYLDYYNCGGAGSVDKYINSYNIFINGGKHANTKPKSGKSTGASKAS